MFKIMLKIAIILAIISVSFYFGVKQGYDIQENDCKEILLGIGAKFQVDYYEDYGKEYIDRLIKKIESKELSLNATIS